MSSSVIQVQNLSKAYQLGQFNTGTIGMDFQRWLASIRGKEDPFLRIGEVNDRENRGKSNMVWSLKDIDFSINKGEAVGIIGRNGAGKSTLLKLLSRVTSPTTGTLKLKGRVASLLEVGTGFHPELSGRDNIFLNGAILGMRKREIASKFDEIVDFAGVERYIDTPVKRYSSGMYVRLAFAVAAHLESEILIVDEVLAVGDADFQKKCLGKMNAVSKSDGRTILFVSHNMKSISALCQKTIVLDKGTLALSATTEESIQFYLNSSGDFSLSSKSSLSDRLNRTGGEVRFSNVSGMAKDSNNPWRFDSRENIRFELSYEVFSSVNGLGIYAALVSPSTSEVVTNTKELLINNKIADGESGKFILDMGATSVLRAGEYNLYLCLTDERFGKFFDVIDHNVGLPSLFISSESEDPHNQIGYFNIKSSIQALEHEKNT